MWLSLMVSLENLGILSLACKSLAAMISFVGVLVVLRVEPCRVSQNTSCTHEK